MLSLARMGEYGAALRVYEKCRQMLKTELNLLPSPQTEQLRLRIRQLQNQPVPQLLEMLALIGRQEEVKHISNLLTQHRLVTIVGTGGMGKTHLATAIAHQQTSHFLEGVHLIPLASLSDPTSLARTIATALSIDTKSSPEATLLNHLAVLGW